MSVELALFRGDELLCQGSIAVTQTPASSEFPLEDRGVLVISHEFALPACSLGLQLRPSAESEPLIEAGVAMGVHDSDDRESVALGPDYTLGFFCHAITTPPAER
jgi:hypothetical protein